MEKTQMENRIKDLLEAKIQNGDLELLHEFYEIPGLYEYSFYNRILIWIQGGTVCNSYNNWKRMGRYVKKGEKARIDVLVPIIKNDKGTDGQEENSRCVGFISRHVFDVSQTDGKPMEYKRNTTEKIEYEYDLLRNKLAQELKLHISTGFTGTARGYFRADDKSIMISEMSTDTDKIKTLFHEIGHALLHSGEDSEQSTMRGSKEVEAELVSLLICNSLGVNFKHSELYIQAWNKNKPEVQVMKVISAVQKVLKIVMGTK